VRLARLVGTVVGGHRRRADRGPRSRNRYEHRTVSARRSDARFHPSRRSVTGTAHLPCGWSRIGWPRVEFQVAPIGQDQGPEDAGRPGPRSGTQTRPGPKLPGDGEREQLEQGG